MKHVVNLATGLVVVPCRLCGPRADIVVDLALDTGATFTLISWTVAIALGYDPVAASGRLRIITGSGSEYCPRVT